MKYTALIDKGIVFLPHQISFGSSIKMELILFFAVASCQTHYKTAECFRNLKGKNISRHFERRPVTQLFVRRNLPTRHASLRSIVNTRRGAQFTRTKGS